MIESILIVSPKMIQLSLRDAAEILSRCWNFLSNNITKWPKKLFLEYDSEALLHKEDA